MTRWNLRRWWSPQGGAVSSRPEGKRKFSLGFLWISPRNGICCFPTMRCFVGMVWFCDICLLSKCWGAWNCSSMEYIWANRYQSFMIFRECTRPPTPYYFLYLRVKFCEGAWSYSVSTIYCIHISLYAHIYIYIYISLEVLGTNHK